MKPIQSLPIQLLQNQPSIYQTTNLLTASIVKNKKILQQLQLQQFQQLKQFQQLQLEFQQLKQFQLKQFQLQLQQLQQQLQSPIPSNKLPNKPLKPSNQNYQLQFQPIQQLTQHIVLQIIIILTNMLHLTHSHKQWHIRVILVILH